MSDDNVIQFPNKIDPEAEAKADFFYVMAVYFVQNFKDLFKDNTSELPLYIAFLTLTEVMDYHIAEGDAYIKEDAKTDMIQLAMREGLHDLLLKDMKELAAEYDERKENDIH